MKKRKRTKPANKLDDSYYGWKCPECGATKFKAEYTRNRPGGRLRKIKCACGASTYTNEKIIQPWSK